MASQFGESAWIKDYVFYLIKDALKIDPRARFPQKIEPVLCVCQLCLPMCIDGL